MKTGDLVRLRDSANGVHETVVGIVIALHKEYARMVDVMWSDGKRGFIDKEILEVASGSR